MPLPQLPTVASWKVENTSRVGPIGRVGSRHGASARHHPKQGTRAAGGDVPQCPTCKRDVDRAMEREANISANEPLMPEDEVRGRGRTLWLRATIPMRRLRWRRGWMCRRARWGGGSSILGLLSSGRRDRSGFRLGCRVLAVELVDHLAEIRSLFPGQWEPFDLLGLERAPVEVELDRFVALGVQSSSRGSGGRSPLRFACAPVETPM